MIRILFLWINIKSKTVIYLFYYLSENFLYDEQHNFNQFYQKEEEQEQNIYILIEM